MYEVPSTKYEVRSRNRKYEIRNTESRPTSNAERRVLNGEGKYNVPGRKRYKMQEIRLSSVDMKILPTEQDFHLALLPAAAGI